MLTPLRQSLVLSAVVATSCGAPEEAAPTPVADPAGYRLEVLADGLDHPWSLAFLPDGAMLVTERSGALLYLSEGGAAPQPVSGVPAVHAAGQGGLLEVTLHPDFSENQTVFLSYAHGDSGANTIRVARARFDENALGLDDLEVIFEAAPLRDTDVHYGGRMAFLPDDTLLVGLGEGFEFREEAQRLQNHLGAIVRITADGEAPPDNPFLTVEGARPEIWSFGHRNVQGLLVDPRDGTVWSHEHGPRGGDEVNVVEAGGNYGWPIATTGVDYSGAVITPFATYEGMVAPVHDWTPSIAPAGFAMYAGELFPEWRGDLFVAALVSRDVRRLERQADRVVGEESLFSELNERIRDVRAGPDGALYLLTDNAQGRLFRVTPAE